MLFSLKQEAPTSIGGGTFTGNQTSLESHEFIRGSVNERYRINDIKAVDAIRELNAINAKLRKMEG